MLLGAAIPVLVLLAALVFVTVVKTAHTVSALRALRLAFGEMDGSTRRLAVVAMVPALAEAIWLSIRGLDPPTAIVFGMAIGSGLFAAALGILGMERVVLETSFETALRRAQKLRPKTSLLSRAVAIGGGLSIVAGAFVLLDSV